MTCQTSARRGARRPRSIGVVSCPALRIYLHRCACDFASICGCRQSQGSGVWVFRSSRPSPPQACARRARVAGSATCRTRRGAFNSADSPSPLLAAYVPSVGAQAHRRLHNGRSVLQSPCFSHLAARHVCRRGVCRKLCARSANHMKSWKHGACMCRSAVL